MFDGFVAIAFILALTGLHVFLCLRFFAHAGDVIKGVKLPRHAIGALLGFVGLALMALAMLATWAIIAVTLYAWLGLGKIEETMFSFMFTLIVMAVAPVVHLIAEMLVNVSYNEA